MQTILGIPGVCIGVKNLNDDILWQLKAKLLKHSSGITHTPGTVAASLVPAAAQTAMLIAFAQKEMKGQAGRSCREPCTYNTLCSAHQHCTQEANVKLGIEAASLVPAVCSVILWHLGCTTGNEGQAGHSSCEPCTCKTACSAH